MSDNKKVLKGLNFPGLEGTYYVPEAVAFEEENGYIDVLSVVSDTVEIENLDTTLTRAGFAADAKAVGEALKPYIIPVLWTGDSTCNFMPGFEFNWEEIVSILQENNRTIMMHVYYNDSLEEVQMFYYNYSEIYNNFDNDYMSFASTTEDITKIIYLNPDGSMWAHKDNLALAEHIDNINERIYIKANYEPSDTIVTSVVGSNSSIVAAMSSGFLRKEIYGNPWKTVYLDNNSDYAPKKIIYNKGLYTAISELGYIYFSFDDGKHFNREDSLYGTKLIDITFDADNEFFMALGVDAGDFMHIYQWPLPESMSDISISEDEEYADRADMGYSKIIYHNQKIYCLALSGNMVVKENGQWNSGYSNFPSSNYVEIALFENSLIAISNVRFDMLDLTTGQSYSFAFGNYVAYRDLSSPVVHINNENSHIYIVDDYQLFVLNQLIPHDGTIDCAIRRRKNKVNNDDHWRTLYGTQSYIYAAKFSLNKDDNETSSHLYTFTSGREPLADFSIHRNGYHSSLASHYLRTSIEAAPKYTYGTEDLEPGVSSLETGTLYFVYE